MNNFYTKYKGSLSSIYRRFRLTRYTLIIVGIVLVDLSLITTIVKNISYEKPTEARQEIINNLIGITPAPSKVIQAKPTSQLVIKKSTPSPVVTNTSSTTPVVGTGKIRGVHKDYKNNELHESWLKITLRNTATNQTYQSTDKPNWSFSNLPPGTYRISADVSSDYLIYYTDCVNCKNNMSDVSGNEFTIKLDANSDFETLFKFIAKKDSTSQTTSANTPTPEQGKPEFSIGYPQEGQTITFTNPDQRLCIATTPIKNTSGAVIYYNLNNGGWIIDCFLPPEGQNTVQVKIKNGSNIESDVQTRSFTFQADY